MTDTSTDLDGNPYIPIRSYGWMTDAHRATCALHMACDPSQIEFRLDARAKMDALTSLKARMQQTLDHAQATGPNPTSQRALEYRLAEAINALSSTPSPAPSASMGWVMVPREPTEAMIDAARHFLEPATERIGRAAWAAMLASLPASATKDLKP